MDNLFIKFKLKSLDEWAKKYRKKIIRNGGQSLLSQYKKNLKFLLTTIYPNYPWENLNFIIQKKNNFKLKSIEDFKEFMEKLFIKFNLKSFEDWRKISRKKLQKNGGYSLLLQYKNDNMKKILTSIYPNYPWENSFINFRDNLSSKIKELIDKYHITQKKDWYRLPNDSISKYDLYKTLFQFYPSEKWKKSNFHFRSKQTTQRLLFSFTQKIYPSLLIFEDYFHPKLIHSENYELDIFIPALQLALEYQGQHHYDDIPSGFAGIEVAKHRDEVKEKLAKALSIKMIYIPYWWDQSLSSLQSSLI